MSIVQINLLSVPEGRGPQLEQRFAGRRRAVDGTPGFEGFDLLRPVSGDNDRYLVLTRWESQEAFDAWRTGRAFQEGHAGGGQDDAAQKRAHADQRREGDQPTATDSELWGFEVVDLDALAGEAG